MYQRLRQSLQSNVQTLRQKGSFAQNFAITFSGTAFVAVLGVLVTPLMSRIYSPQSYGLFAVFNSIVNNVSLVSTFLYPSAFILPTLRKRFLALVQLTVGLSVVAFGLLVVVIVVFKEPLLRWLHAEALGNWLYLVPVTVFLFNIDVVMGAWYLRTKSFKKRAGIEVAASLAGRGLTLGYGGLTHGSVGGLIVGDIFSKTTAFFSLLFNGIHRHLGEIFSHISWPRIKAVAYEFREYPLYVMPTGYLNVVASQLPIFFLTSSFGTSVVGLYAFSTGLLEIPIGLIGNAVAPVFLQKATETHQNEPERLKDLCLSLYNKLFYLGLLPFGVITVFGDWIFGFVFGKQWIMAGLFTSYLGYYYVFKLAGYATSPIYAVLRRQRVALYGTVLLVVARAMSLLIGTQLHDLRLGMLLFGVSSLAVTFLVDMNILYLLKVPVTRVVVRSILLVGLTLLVLWGVRAGLTHLWPRLASYGIAAAFPKAAVMIG